MKAILLKLTQTNYKPADIVDADEYQLVSYPHNDQISLDVLPLSICMTATRKVMDGIVVDPVHSRLYIIVDLTPKRIACAYMVASAFAEINVPAYMWVVTKDPGVYISLDEFRAEGHDWAQTIKDRQREQELIKALDQA